MIHTNIDIDVLYNSTSPVIRTILEKALRGEELSVQEGTALFHTDGKELEALLKTADIIRKGKVGDTVSFVITRNINFTNVCYMGCKFCAFSKRMEDSDATFLTFDKIARRSQEAWDRGATEVCIQGGLHPKIKGDHYRNILKTIKDQVPDMHIHAFSPFEIWYGSKLSNTTPEAFLKDLKDHGLGSMPGTAAEILDIEVREQLTQDKLSADEWAHIIKTAHNVGLRSTSTIMYGHVDEPRHWAAHIGRIRDIQKETGGFTEFVPLGFIHYDAPIYLEGKARAGPTYKENLQMHAVARVMLNGWINNIQVSWVKMGPEVAQKLLQGGGNDLGGTLMNESISRAAGAPHGQEITPAEMVRIIRGAGRTPVQRNTIYEVVEKYDDHNPLYHQPLVKRCSEQAERITNIC